MKQSPPRAATPNPAMESPKAKCSGGKGGHHSSSGCSSNTSTPKHPDSTSAKKPSSSKEPTPNEQEKSPQSPALTGVAVLLYCLLSQSGINGKESTQKTPTHSTPHSLSALVHLMASTVQWDPSDITELQPPSITSTPLALCAPRQWRTTSKESRHSLGSLYTSPSFNFPGHPVAGPGNLTPSIPSLAGSHHVSSTWPPGTFTSRPSSPHLTIDQANSLFKLAAECQALGIKWQCSSRCCQDWRPCTTTQSKAWHTRH